MIKSIRIKNFKCFLDATFEFSSLTLLSGINGSGKSSLIQLMLLLRQTHLQGFLNKGLSLHGDYLHLGSALDALCEFANEDEILAEVRTGDATATWSFDASKEVDYLDLIQANSRINEKVFISPLFGKGFHYLGPERIGPRVVQSRNDIAVGDYRNVGKAGEFTASFLNLHGTEILTSDARLHKKAASNSLMQQVEAWMSEFTSEIRIQVQEYRGTDQFQITYSSELKSGTTGKYRATNVGFGLSFVLPVIVTLLAAKAGDLIIIDTPEAHLHPKGQFKIGELIALTAKSGIQVIIETHSDHVLNGVRLSVYDQMIAADQCKFFYLNKTAVGGDLITKIHSPKIDENGRFDDWPSGFFDEWNVSLQKLLQPRDRK